MVTMMLHMYRGRWREVNMSPWTQRWREMGGAKEKYLYVYDEEST
jgi:hypothetical protein